ncbi:MAG: NAD(P)H-hydrate dehydratase [Rickettsiales bacterium]|nr:NAD(P)H-hydrate dehydratase [Rickettsiales bacterium]
MQFKLPTHQNNSHKGQVGKVLIVGGNKQYYGAPILTALGAENSGADLITLFLPDEHINVAKTYSLNFFLKSFEKEYLSEQDIEAILTTANDNHVLIIGNGLGKNSETKSAVIKILTDIKIPVVVDAEALFPDILNINNKNLTLTPHRREFEKLFDCKPTSENVQQQAIQYSSNILLKGSTDIVASAHGHLYENKKTCPQMRVGGTGDVLAGIVGSFISQELDPYTACCSAVYYFGKCGEKLIKQTKWLSAHKMISNFSESINLI